ncbi:hypothetical protein MBLNU230_g0804t1 [Neophaeotheca triangularis]
MAANETNDNDNGFDYSDLESGPLQPPPAGRFDTPQQAPSRGSLNFSLRGPPTSGSHSATDSSEAQSARSQNSPNRSGPPISKFSEELTEPKSMATTTTAAAKPTTGNPLPPVTAEAPDSTASHSPPPGKHSRSMDIMEYMKQHGQASFAHSATSLLPPGTASTQAATDGDDHVADEKPETAKTGAAASTRPASSLTFASRVFEAGKPHLLYDVAQRRGSPCGVLDLTTLQRMNQHVLQQKLVEQVRALGKREAWMEIGIQQTLHAYCESIRDAELMAQHASRGMAHDPFLITTSDGLETKLLEEAGLITSPRLNDKAAKTSSASSTQEQKHPQRLTPQRRETPKKRSLRRLLMALTAALSLVVPMLIMMLVDGQLTKIITGTAFAVAFAFAFGVGSEMEPDKVAGVVGLYAAVLVVFVSNNPPAY